jgi:hypothetical protein
MNTQTFLKNFAAVTQAREYRADANGWRTFSAPKRVRVFPRRWGAALLAFALPVIGTSDIQTTTQNMSASVSPYGKLSLPASVSLRTADARFGGTLSGSLTVNYWARTSEAGGGSVTVQAGTAFSPAGGPSIADVTYFCSGATLGAGCSGNQSLTPSTQTPAVSLPAAVCTGGGSTCSTQEPNSVLLTFSAPDKPLYKTGTYSAQITFTISTL